MLIKINENTPNERVIGELVGNTFKKKVKKSFHLFRKLDAWGIDGRYFRDVLLPNNYTIHVHDTEDNRIYITTAEQIDKNGQYYHFKKEEDHKAQIFLPRRYWQTADLTY